MIYFDVDLLTCIFLFNMPRPRCERPEWVKTKNVHLSEKKLQNYFSMQKYIGQPERNYLRYKKN